MELGEHAPKVYEEDVMRADMYALMGSLMFAAPDANILEVAKSLTGDKSELGEAINVLAKLSQTVTCEELREEFDALFIGIGRGEVLPFASYYLTGFLNEKPLAKLRGDMRALGIERNSSVKEPEDHIAILCEMMAGLIMGNYGDAASLAVQKKFFEAHIGIWAEHFFNDLEAAQSSRFYQPVARIGRLFIEIEKDAFSMC